MVRPLLILLAACSAPPAAPVAAQAAPVERIGDAPAAGVRAPGDAGVLATACEASSIVPWNGGWLVGDNEDTRSLYAYDLDFTPRGPVGLASEVDDIEALAVRDGGYFVVGSHSTNKDGEPRPLRERILSSDGTTAPFSFAACPACVAARGLAPDRGGFNIEGAAVWGGRLWLGLRAPLSARGEALLLGLDDGGAVTETLPLDLGGLGVREMIPDGDSLLVVAGPTADADAAHTLFRLDADRTVTRLPVTLPPSTEGIALDPTRPDTLVYVTDGDGKPGKCRTPATWGRIPLPR